MRVRFDSAVFTIGGWLQSYEAMSHPDTAGVRDDRNEFGVVIGASVDAHWPARPIIVGRFGNGDPGDPGRADHAMLGNEKYDPGELLGDVVLAAEQRVGNGRIILFGDPSMMTNGLLHGCYDYDARLLAYASNRSGSPQDSWRQILSFVLVLGLLACIVLQPHPIRIAAAALLMAASIFLCTDISHRNATLIPGPFLPSPAQSKLVYIDESHMEAASLEAWREEGVMGLLLDWEREGYMALGLNELTYDRLRRARAYISVAPAKPFSDAERTAIENYVKKGGIFICTAGYDRSQASEQLLADFGLYVGAHPGEPHPSLWVGSNRLTLPWEIFSHTCASGRRGRWSRIAFPINRTHNRSLWAATVNRSFFCAMCSTRQATTTAGRSSSSAIPISR